MATTTKRSGKKRMRKANESLRKSPTWEDLLWDCRSDARSLAKAIKQIDNLLLKGELDPTTEQALLNALTDAVAKFRAMRFKYLHLRAWEFAAHLVEANDLATSETC